MTDYVYNKVLGKWEVESSAIIELTELADIASQRILGRVSSGSGNVEELPPASVQSILGYAKTDDLVTSWSDTPLDSNFPSEMLVKDSLDSKLDASSYNEHYKGKFASLGALQTAHPTANIGDYAQVDEGAGYDVVNFSWDSEDGWIIGSSGSGATSTDELPEGSTNLYFSAARVRDVLLTGLSTATNRAILATDKVLEALGILQAQINDRITATQTVTLSNKRITERVVSIASSATPTIDVDVTDVFEITALATNITSFSFTGTPENKQIIEISIIATATRTIDVGSSIIASDIPVPTTTNGTTPLVFTIQYHSSLGKYVVVGSSAQSSGITLTTTGSGAATLVGATLNVPTPSPGSTDNALVRADGTGNNKIQGSPVTVGDNGEIAGYRTNQVTFSGTTAAIDATSVPSGSIIRFTNASAVAATIANSIPAGWCCSWIQQGAGQVTFSVTGGSLNNVNSYTKSKAQKAMGTLYCDSNAGTAPVVYLAGEGA